MASKAENAVLWGFILRIFIENMLPLFMCCLINMLYPFGQYSSSSDLTGGRGEVVATVFAYLTFVSAWD